MGLYRASYPTQALALAGTRWSPQVTAATLLNGYAELTSNGISFLCHMDFEEVDLIQHHSFGNMLIMCRGCWSDFTKFKTLREKPVSPFIRNKTDTKKETATKVTGRRKNMAASVVQSMSILIFHVLICLPYMTPI